MDLTEAAQALSQQAAKIRTHPPHLPAREINREDVKFKVQANGSTLGTLHISQGTIEWRDRRNRKSAVKLSWSDFIALIKNGQ